MTRQHRPPQLPGITPVAQKRESGTRQPTHQDDLKRLKGIGPATERRLYKAGIRSFAVLAKQSPERLAELVPGLSAKQIAIRGWIHQAQRLSSRRSKKTAEHAFPAALSRQRYATFTLELLLDGSDRVRRTRVVHVQSGDENQWSAWDESRLISYIMHQADMKFLSPPKTKASHLDAKTYATPEIAEAARHIPPTANAYPEPQPEAGDIQLFSISVTKIELFPRAARIHTQFEFELTGPMAAEVVARHSRFFAEILACDLLTGQLNVMTSFEWELQANQFSYSLSLEFPAPKVGRYQLVAIVLLPQEDAVTIQLGPILTMIP